ncbi:MAG TPA: hypothetical protein VFK05_05365 [Polyangiaceae bacterium]|nr:hypothetical protein [Polyangiaceae bacterium]
MQRFSLRSRAPLFGLLVLGACSSATDELQPITSTPEDYCQRSCEKAHSCNDTVDPPACRSSCQAALAESPKLRGDFLGYVATCVQASSCSSASTSKCESEARAQLPASTFGNGFCSAYLEASANCDAAEGAYPQSTCLEAAKTYDDSALKAGNDCLAQSCSELSACLDQALPEVTLAL